MTSSDPPPTELPRSQGPLATSFAVPSPSEAAAPTDWSVGDVILGLYEVAAVLGEGGMGRVHRVRHRGWNTDLAVKSPRPGVFATKQGQESFVREAETWVNLGLHPHIVSCHYVRTLGGVPRVFAEYLDGGSLADWIRSRKLYEGGPEAALERILDIAIQFAWGLDYAHEQGVVHQDVKPANLMLTLEGTAKVTDFGLARARALAGEELPRTGQLPLVAVAGMTPTYCSPEQARGQLVSRKTDIWSWAVSVLEMFLGEVVWKDGALAAAVLEDYLQSGSTDDGLPRMPQTVSNLLGECLVVDPSRRPESLKHAASLLRSAYQEATGITHSRSEPTQVGLTADGLNNRALSLLDLGKEDGARNAWTAALAADPDHLHATYNRATTLWGRGEINDDEVIAAIETVRARHADDPESQLLLGLAQLERGDWLAALPLLEGVVGRVSDDVAVSEVLAQARDFEREAGSVRLPECYKKEAFSVSLSVDGRRALAVGNDGPSVSEGLRHVRLWDATTGELLSEEEVEGKSLRVHLGDAGDTVVAARYGGGWSVRYLAEHRVVEDEGRSDSCRLACVSPDGRWLLASSGRMSTNGRETSNTSSPVPVHLIDLVSKSQFQLGGHVDGAISLAFGRDGRLGLSSGLDGARLWDLARRNCLFELKTALRTALSRDGRTVFAATFDDQKLLRRCQLWSADDGRLVGQFDSGHLHNIEWVAVSSDGTVGATAAGSSLKVWDLTASRCLRTLSSRRDSSFHSASLSGDGRWLLSGGTASYEDSLGPLRLIRLPDPRLQVCSPRLSRLWSVVQTAESRGSLERLLTEARGAMTAGQYPAALHALRQAREQVGFQRAPEVRAAWKRLSKHCVRVDLRGARVLKTIEGHSGPVAAAFLSADGRFLLSKGMGGSIVVKGADKHVVLDNTLRLWDLESGRCLDDFGDLSAWDRIPLSEQDEAGKPCLGKAFRAVLAAWCASARRQLPFVDRGPLDSWTDGRLVFVGNAIFAISTGRCLRAFAGRIADVSLDGCYVLTSEADGGTLAGIRVSASGACEETLPFPADGALRFLRGSRATGQSLVVQIQPRKARGASLSVRRGEREPKVMRTFAPRDTTTMWGVQWAAISDDGEVAVWDDSLFKKAERRFVGTLNICELEYELEAREAADWDEAARLYLEAFLTVHAPTAGDLPVDRQPSDEEVCQALTRSGTPRWSESDFENLVQRLQREQLGWLRPAGVRSELERMAVDWAGPRRPVVQTSKPGR